MEFRCIGVSIEFQTHTVEIGNIDDKQEHNSENMKQKIIKFHIRIITSLTVFMNITFHIFCHAKSHHINFRCLMRDTVFSLHDDNFVVSDKNILFSANHRSLENKKKVVDIS